MRRVLFILLTPTIVLLSLWASIDFLLLPKVEIWAKKKITEITATGPVGIRLGEIDLRLLPPKAEVRSLTITPRGELARTLNPLTIDSVQARMNFFEILLGRAELSAVVIRGLHGHLLIDPLIESDKPARPLPIATLFQWSDRLPLRRIILEDSTWGLSSEKMHAKTQLELREASLVNRGQVLRLSAEFPRITTTKGDLQPLDLFGYIALELTAKSLELQDLRLEKDEIRLRARGLAEDVEKITIKPKLRLRADAHLPLKEVQTELTALMKDKDLHIPSASGLLTAQTDVVLTGSTEFKSSVKVQTEDVRIDKFDIGDARLQGTLTEGSFEIDQVGISHPAGTVDLKDARIDFRQPYAFRANVQAPAFDLQELFQSLGLKEIPVHTKITGTLPCQGTARPFELRCSGRLSSNHLLVHTGPDKTKNTLVSLRDLEVEGQVRVTTESTTFKTQLRIGSSRGQAEGTVDFHAGFKIDYATPLLKLQDVENLANLKMEGQGSIQGHTRGDSHAATFDMRLETKDFIFENFILGDVDGQLGYQAGHLHFNDLELRKGRTTAKGQMTLDLSGSLINGEVQAPALDAADLADVFSRLWKIPLEVQSGGQAKMTFDGPLNLWKMNYRLDADLKAPKIHGDQFDSMKLIAKGESGNLTIERGDLTKNQSAIRLRGGITNEQQMRLALEVTALRLEESEFVTRIRNNLAGRFNMTGSISGPLHQPEFRAKGSLSDMIMDEQEIPTSFFNLMLSRTQLSCESNLFGNKIQTEIQIPLGQATTPLRLRLKTTDWAFTNLLSLIGAASLQSEYRSSLTADLDLSSPHGRMDQVTGLLSIRNLALQRGDHSLKNPKTMEASFENGNITLRNFALEGPGGSALRARGTSFRLNDLNVNLFADADMKLLQMLTPFLDDLSGPFRMEATLGGSLFQPVILGNASIRNGFVRLKGFPHALEKLQADIVFSQSRILIQDIRGHLADGTLRGSGSVQILGPKDIPVNIRIQGENLHLNVPDRVRTTGHADLNFSGNWFPFILSGTYNVSGGVAEMELAGGSTSTLRVSPYLPKILRQAQFDPVILDLQVNLDQGVAVRNSMMNGGVSGRLKVKGPPQSPGLLGKITTLRGSKVTIRDRQFELLNGNVTFNHTDEINPDLYVSAQTRVNEYDINILVQGTAKNPLLTTTSNPPLPEPEIISLLALGITSSGSQQTQTSSQGEREAQQQLGYEALGVGLSQTGIQKGLQSTVGVDVRITSTYDSMRNISVPKLSFTRPLTDRLNAVYMRPVNSDSNAQEFRLQYQLNSNVSAIGSYEQRDSQDGTGARENAQKKESIFGLDLEFKREFK